MNRRTKPRRDFGLLGAKALSFAFCAACAAALMASAQTDGSIASADRDDLSTGFIVTGTNLLWSYDTRVRTGSTAWLALAQQGANPFA